jgi:hypothetical protein
MRKICRSTILFIAFLYPFSLSAIETKVTLLSGGEDAYRAKVETILGTVLNTVNRSHELKIPLKNIENYFSHKAYQDFKDLYDKTKFHAPHKEYRTYLLHTADGFFEVRNIKVRVFAGKTKAVPYQNLVFILDKDANIVNITFSIEDHHYQEIIAQGKKLEDLAFREKILHFIEMYRTAYNRKDIDFIEKTLSEDALIIVGYMVKTQKQDRDFLGSSYLSAEKIEFIRLRKYEYLDRLRKVFKNNDFVRVLFEEINIQRHPKFEKIYGVQLKQTWNSSSYSDKGYLFLMVDFVRDDEPIIHVRAWQPEKFTDGSTVSIYDFEIIE